MLFRSDDEARRTYAAVMGVYLAFMGWAALTVALLAPWFLRLLTTEPYWGAAAAITPIAIAGPLYGAYFIAAIGVGRRKANQFNWVVVAAAAVVEVVALLVLVPPFGVVGAGWALVIAYGTMFALMLWREHRVFTVPYAWGRIARELAVDRDESQVRGERGSPGDNREGPRPCGGPAHLRTGVAREGCTSPVESGDVATGPCNHRSTRMEASRRGREIPRRRPLRGLPPFCSKPTGRGSLRPVSRPCGCGCSRGECPISFREFTTDFMDRTDGGP